jgi:hypothetical protein
MSGLADAVTNFLSTLTLSFNLSAFLPTTPTVTQAPTPVPIVAPTS